MIKNAKLVTLDNFVVGILVGLELPDEEGEEGGGGVVRGNHEKHDVVDDLLVRQALREHEGDHVAERRALPALQLGPPLLDDPRDGAPPAPAGGEAPSEPGEWQVQRDRPNALHQLLELRRQLPPGRRTPSQAGTSPEGRLPDAAR